MGGSDGGSDRAGCYSLESATPEPDLWCSELEKALERRGRQYHPPQTGPLFPIWKLQLGDPWNELELQLGPQILELPYLEDLGARAGRPRRPRPVPLPTTLGLYGRKRNNLEVRAAADSLSCRMGRCVTLLLPKRCSRIHNASNVNALMQ